MTEATSGQAELAEFFQIWGDTFSQILSQITGSAVPCVVLAEAPENRPPPAEDDLWVVVTAAGALRGEMSSRIAAATVLGLAQIFTSEPPTPGVAPTADHREAVVELFRQVCGVVSTKAKARWGEIQLLAEAAPAMPSWASAVTFWLRVGADGATAQVLEMVLSAALVAELRVEKATPANADTMTAATAPEPGSATLDLLMDVQLAMTMRFGTRKLALREVLDLSPGSVIELDRKVKEPVELLLDGKVIALGEVVVIEGDYGLRVTDVSPLELA